MKEMENIVVREEMGDVEIREESVDNGYCNKGRDRGYLKRGRGCNKGKKEKKKGGMRFYIVMRVRLSGIICSTK